MSQYAHPQVDKLAALVEYDAQSVEVAKINSPRNPCSDFTQLTVHICTHVDTYWPTRSLYLCHTCVWAN